VRVADLQKSVWQEQVWYFSLKEKEPRRFTISEGNDTQPEWSPDGSWLTFVSDRKISDQVNSKVIGEKQIWAIPADGGEARPWTFLSRDVEEYCWNRNGKALYVLTKAEKPPAVFVRESQRTKLKFEEVVRHSFEIISSLNFAGATVKKMKCAISGGGSEPEITMLSI